MRVPLRGSDVRRKFIGDEFQGRVVREVEGATLEMSCSQKEPRVRIPNSPPQKACKQARLQAF